jgi:hypothetical protein
MKKLYRSESSMALISWWLDTCAMATGSFFLSKQERFVWNIVFMVFLVVFVLGSATLAIGTYRSFVNLFTDKASAVIAMAAEKGTSAN